MTVFVAEYISLFFLHSETTFLCTGCYGETFLSNFLGYLILLFC